MNAVLALGLACCAIGCSPAAKPPIDPVLPPGSMTLEPDVRDLIAKHVALVRELSSPASAHGSLGLVYEANDLWVPAEASYANAAILDPGAPLWRYHRAVVLREVGRTVESNELLLKAAAELPKDPGVQHRLGVVLLELGDVAGSEAAFRRALGAAPGHPSCLVGLAFVCIARDDWAGARDLCLPIVKDDPGFQQAQYALGLAYRGLGDAKHAAIALNLGAEGKTRYLDDPLSAELKSYRVNIMSQITETQVLEKANRNEEALAIWARMVARNPDQKTLITNYGAALLALGRADEAIVQLNRSLALDENEFATHMDLAEAFSLKKQFEQARVHADRAVALAPQVARTHRTRAGVLAAGHEFEAAYQELRRAVELDPHDSVAFGALAEISTLSGHADEAKGWFQMAVDVDPTNLSAFVNLARLNLNAGATEIAMAQVQELLERAPNDKHVRALAAQLGLSRR